MKFVAGSLLRNPSRAAGGLVFSLAFALVAGNALWSQPGSHPDPIWKTRDMAMTRSIAVRPEPVSIARSVLTQKISLKNIPVPTASPVRRNMVSAHSSLVRDVQLELSKIGLYDGKVDGIYGGKTREAITIYQENAGILPDGEASFGLLTNLKSAVAVNRLGSGSDGNRVENIPVPKPQLPVLDSSLVLQIQQGLNRFGYEGIDVDGVIGNQTRNAIRKFQERYRLEVTGEPNDETVRKLVSVGAMRNS